MNARKATAARTTDRHAAGKAPTGPRLAGVALSDWELWACASHQIKQHGDDAEFCAALRCDELLAGGDLAGHRVWLAIAGRIEALTAPHGRETAH